MSYRLQKFTALLNSAVFVFSASVYAQAPIVDASIDSGASARPSSAPAAAPAEVGTSNSNQSELFYQLQLLQQEVMQLRGVVEEQSFELNKLKEQNMERYIDLDRRLGELAANPSTAVTVGGSANTGVASPSSPSAVPAAVKGEKAAYDAAYAMVTNRRFDDALEAFKQFLVDYPRGHYTPNSYYWLGELYQVISPQDLEGARQAFTQLIERYPEHSKVADAMYKLGKVYFLKGNKAKSRHWLDRTIADYSKGPSSSAAYKAQQFINANF